MPTENSAGTQLPLVRFYLSHDCYCLETPAVASIRRWEETESPAEDRPDAIATVQFPGGTAPVYSLRSLLALGEEDTASGPVLMVRSPRHTYGIRVDRVARTISVDPSLARGLHPALCDPHGRVRGVVQLPGELALLLSPAFLAPLPAGLAPLPPDPPLPPPSLWTSAPPPASGKKLLCFAVPSEDPSTLFAFSLRQIIEIVQGLRMFRVSANDKCVAGMVEWRGHVVPVIHPSALLGVSHGPPDWENAKFAILRGAQTQALFALPAHDFAALSAPLSATAGNGARLPKIGPFVRAAYKLTGGCLVLPDLDRLALA
ncbi:MAG: chemotaxis protein CheW [Acidobacteria bacterium]|nr:chemotaxis protein CheW [Acidobacteriota bacterium]